MTEQPQFRGSAEPPVASFAPAPVGDAAPTTVPAGPEFTAPSSYQPSAVYPPAPAPIGYPPPPAYPPPGQPAAAPWSRPTAAEAPSMPAEVVGTERVGRGLLFSVIGVLIGMVAAATLWQLNFVAGLTSAVMAYACVWFYIKGAGSTPRKGAMPLVLVILFGVFASLVAAFASDAVQAAAKIYPGNLDKQISWTTNYLLNSAVWAEHTNVVMMFLIFAALGSYGLVVGLAKSGRS